MTPWLLLLAVAAHLLPEHLAALHGTQAAWEYVATGVQACALWLVVGLLLQSIAVRAVAAWGAIESGERAMCRALLPMDTKPALLPGQTLCEAALGAPFGWLSLVFAAAVVFALAGEHRAA